MNNASDRAGSCTSCGQHTSLLVDTDICISCRRSKALAFFGKVDYKLLSVQKQFLLEIAKSLDEIRKCEQAGTFGQNEHKLGFVDILAESPPEVLDGIINFLDAFQDCAADDMQIGEDVVIGIELQTKEVTCESDQNGQTQQDG